MHCEMITAIKSITVCFMTVAVLRGAGQLFCRMPPISVCRMVCSWLNGANELVESALQSRAPSRCIQSAGTRCRQDLLRESCQPLGQGGVCRLHHRNVAFPTPRSVLGKKVTKSSPHLGAKACFKNVSKYISFEV